MEPLEQLTKFGETISQIQAKIAEFEKTVASSDTAFPVRENLSAEAKLLVPVDTPLLNRLPTVPGSGKAAAWKEITSFGATPTGDNVFYAEGGAPSGRTTVYADRSESYKLLGLDGGVTAFAVAAGANFQDQLAKEKSNTILHLKNLEEAALINATGTGNSFTGILTQVTTANGSYSAATTGTAPSAVREDIELLFKATWDKGANTDALLVRSAEAKLISQAYTKDTTSPLRVVLPSPDGVVAGFYVSAIINPINGRNCALIPDMRHTTGTIVGIVFNMPIPVPNQGSSGIYLDVLLDYAMSDVPNTSDSFSFRIKRYLTLAIPARKFFAAVTGFA